MEYKDTHSIYTLPAFNQDNAHVYTALGANDCIGNGAVYLNQDHETRTYEFIQRPLRTENVPQKNLKRKSRNKFVVVILAICIAILVSTGITYIVTIQFNKNDVTTNNKTSNNLLSQKDSCANSAKNTVNGTLGTNTVVNSLRLPMFQTECPVGWLKNGLSCYKVTDDKKTWFRALDFCRSFGSDLVSFPDQHEEDFIRQSLHKGSRYWIGLHDIDKDDKFEWSDGTVSKYTNWGPSEPNRFNSMEDCVELAPNGVWNDANCYISQNFICKIELTSKCGKGSWEFFNNSCYMFNKRGRNNFELSWNSARQYCKRNDADLAIIKSKEELYFLLSQSFKMLSPMNWIGLTNNKLHSEYIWIDGTVSHNLPWDKNQPRTSRAGCGMITKHGNFAGINCASKNGYICEKQL